MSTGVAVRAAIFAGAFPATLASAQAGPPATDIFLAPLAVRGGRLAIGGPVNITRRPGYDNQPSFTPDGRSLLFTSIQSDGQADTYRYDFASGSAVRLTRTPESEYSPAVLPDRSGFSVVRVEADSTQRLWRFGRDGANPRLLLAGVKPVGYYAWADDHTVVLFVLGSPATLQLADTRTVGDRAEPLARDVGRSIQKIPGRHAVSFIQRDSGSGSWIKEVDVATHAIRPIVKALPESQDHAWTPDGTILMASGSKLFQWSPRGGGAADWTEVGAFTDPALQRLSRLAVSPRGDWLAVVAEEAVQARFDFAGRLGVARQDRVGRVCLSAADSAVPAGTHVELVAPFEPQYALETRVVRRRETACDPANAPATGDYDVELAAGSAGEQNLWIAVLGDIPPPTSANGRMTVDLDGDGRNETFRACTSTEGLHLTVWSGQPLAGQRRWHLYYYLGYDVEPDCDERDYAEP